MVTQSKKQAFNKLIKWLDDHNDAVMWQLNWCDTGHCYDCLAIRDLDNISQENRLIIRYRTDDESLDMREKAGE